MLSINTIHEKYLKGVQKVSGIYMKLAECDINGSIDRIEALREYVRLSSQLLQAVAETRLYLELCFQTALSQYHIPLGQKIVFEGMSGYLTIGETPSIFRPSLSAADLAIDGLSILFVRDGEENEPSNLKVRPVFHLKEENYQNPDVFAGTARLKEYISVL